MSNPRERKLLLSILLSLSFCVLGADLSGAQKRPGPDPQAYKNKVTELKNRRDADIAGLVKQRDAQILSLQNGMKEIVDGGLTQIKKDKNYIQLKMKQGQDMRSQQKILMQQEQALMQKSAALQQQINNVKMTYDQQIQKVTQTYAQMFANLQQQMMTQQ